jgi:hypothetical protein
MKHFLPFMIDNDLWVFKTCKNKFKVKEMVDLISLPIQDTYLLDYTRPNEGPVVALGLLTKINSHQF